METLRFQIPSRLNWDAGTTPRDYYRVSDDKVDIHRLREALEQMNRKAAVLKRRVEENDRMSQFRSLSRPFYTPAPTEIDSEDENITTPLPPRPEAQEQWRPRTQEGRQFKSWFIRSVCPYPRPITVREYGAHNTIVCKYCELEMGPEAISEEGSLRRRWGYEVWCQHGRHSAPLRAFIDGKHNSHKTCDGCRTIKTQELMGALGRSNADARRKKEKRVKKDDSEIKHNAITRKAEKRARAVEAERNIGSG